MGGSLRAEATHREKNACFTPLAAAPGASDGGLYSAYPH
jgi:hypothetical protein